VYSVPNYTEYLGDGWATAPSTDGNVLTFQSSVLSTYGYFKSTSHWAAAVDDAVGWTLEFRVKIADSSAAAASTGVPEQGSCRLRE
jgi:hypothetical protein